MVKKIVFLNQATFYSHSFGNNSLFFFSISEKDFFALLILYY